MEKIRQAIEDFLTAMRGENKLGKWGVLAFILGAVIVLGFILGTCQKADASSVNLNWTLPAQNCDLSPLEDYAHTVIRWGDTLGGPYPNTYVSATAQESAATIDVGTVEDTTLYFVLVGRDNSGNESDMAGGCGTSNEVSVPFGPVLPNHPTNATGVAVP